jgi:hypothetical protein
MRDRLPLVLSTTALIVAVFGSTPLGQAAYNAVVPKNSVGAQQLRNGAVTNAKLRGDAVTSGKVKNGSLLSIDFKAGQLPTGPSGAQGTKGDKGDKGDTGAPGLSGYEIVRASTTVPASGISEAQAACPSGKKVIGGAGSVQGLPPGVFIHTQVVEPSIYGAYAVNTTAVSQQVNATAICATVAP